jgi:hypothetical protein
MPWANESRAECAVHAQEAEWFLPENRTRRNAYTTHWRARAALWELSAMAEEQLRAELDTGASRNSSTGNGSISGRAARMRWHTRMMRSRHDACGTDRSGHGGGRGSVPLARPRAGVYRGIEGRTVSAAIPPISHRGMSVYSCCGRCSGRTFKSTCGSSCACGCRQ